MSVNTSTITQPYKKRKLLYYHQIRPVLPVSELVVNQSTVNQPITTQQIVPMDKTFNLNIAERNAKSLDNLASEVSDDMEVENDPKPVKDTKSCPCGYLHGPNQGHHHDIYAVGLSSEPLLRGPD